MSTTYFAINEIRTTLDDVNQKCVLLQNFMIPSHRSKFQKLLGYAPPHPQQLFPSQSSFCIGFRLECLVSSFSFHSFFYHLLYDFIFFNSNQHKTPNFVVLYNFRSQSCVTYKNTKLDQCSVFFKR